MEELIAAPTPPEDWLKGNYKLQYEAMEKWFAQPRFWDWASVTQGSLMVFGWMPTILEGRTKHEHVITKLKASEVARSLNLGNPEEIDVCFVNRSPIGTSKFLHFWRPNLFAIWDSNVCRALTGSDKDAAKRQAFEAYTSAIRECARLHDRSLKDIEQRLFWTGRNAKNGN